MSRPLLLLVFVGSGFGGFVGALLFYVARTAALRLAFWRMGRELRSRGVVQLEQENASKQGPP